MKYIINIETQKRDYLIEFTPPMAGIKSINPLELSILGKVQAVVRQARRDDNPIHYIEVATQRRGKGSPNSRTLLLLKKNDTWGYDYKDETRKPLIKTLRILIESLAI